MMWLKECPRCTTGDVTLDEDGDKICLQCGSVHASSATPSFVKVVKLLRYQDARTQRPATAVAV